MIKNLLFGATKKATILIVDGQSNGEGVVLLSALPEIYRGLKEQVKIWWEGANPNSHAGAFESMQAGLNTVNKIHRDAETYDVQYQWAVEQTATYLLQKKLGRDIFLIKNALGSQSINKWNSPSGIMWVSMKRFIEESIVWLEARKYKIEFNSMIWLQGEADVLSSTNIVTYETLLRAYFTNFRALSPYLVNTVIVMVKMRPYAVGAGTGEPGILAINNVFQTIANEDPTRYKIIEPLAIGATGGSVHYDADGYLKVGEAWYESIQ